MKKRQNKKQDASHGNSLQSASTEHAEGAVTRLMHWLEWVRQEGKEGPSPSRAATILGCTRPMVGQLVRRGLLERSVYEEDGYSIVVISQRSIDNAVASKKSTGCWTMPRPYTWRQIPVTKAERRMGIGMRMRMVATPFAKQVAAAGGLKRQEITLSTDEKLALINKHSPKGGNFTHETEVYCLHCDRVYRAYEAKIVQSHPHDVPKGMPVPEFWIQCKHWPVCSGTVIDWMSQDSEGNYLPGWEEDRRKREEWEASEEGQKAMRELKEGSGKSNKGH